MNERLLKFLAKLFRFTPHFKGKFRVGKLIQKLLNPSSKWKDPEFFIRLKNNTQLFIDVRSRTHIVPFWTGKRDDEAILLIQKNLPKNSVVFDVGANIGYYTLPIALHLKTKNVIVHAFEPVDSNYNSLIKGIKKNKVETRVIPNKLALGDNEGVIEIVKTESGNSGNAVLSMNSDDFLPKGIREQIQMITMDKYINQNSINRCDFIKIDIEGAEIFFIKGAIETIKKFRPIIYGEFNSYFIKKFGFSIVDVWQILAPLDYDVFIENSFSGKFSKTEIKDGMENLLFIPKEKNSANWITIT